MRRGSILVSSVFIALVFVVSSVYAKNSKSEDKNKTNKTVESSEKSTPPGWSKGKKTGWHGSKYPPGWTKWDTNKQKKWTEERDGAADAVTETASRFNIPEAKQNEILNAFEQAIVGGVIINDAKDKLVEALQDENRRKNLLVDTSQRILELLKD